MIEHYLRLSDPLAPVYEVDTVAKTWRLIASRIGALPDVGGALPDDGAKFRGEGFARVWPLREDNGLVTYTRDQPVAAAGRS